MRIVFIIMLHTMLYCFYHYIAHNAVLFFQCVANNAYCFHLYVAYNAVLFLSLCCIQCCIVFIIMLHTMLYCFHHYDAYNVVLFFQCVANNAYCFHHYVANNAYCFYHYLARILQQQQKRLNFWHGWVHSLFLISNSVGCGCGVNKQQFYKQPTKTYVCGVWLGWVRSQP